MCPKKLDVASWKFSKNWKKRKRKRAEVEEEKIKKSKWRKKKWKRRRKWRVDFDSWWDNAVCILYYYCSVALVVFGRCILGERKLEHSNVCFVQPFWINVTSVVRLWRGTLFWLCKVGFIHCTVQFFGCKKRNQSTYSWYWRLIPQKLCSVNLGIEEVVMFHPRHPHLQYRHSRKRGGRKRSSCPSLPADNPWITSCYSSTSPRQNLLRKGGLLSASRKTIRTEERSDLRSTVWSRAAHEDV